MERVIENLCLETYSGGSGGAQMQVLAMLRREIAPKTNLHRGGIKF